MQHKNLLLPTVHSSTGGVGDCRKEIAEAFFQMVDAVTSRLSVFSLPTKTRTGQRRGLLHVAEKSEEQFLYQTMGSGSKLTTK